MIDRRAVAVAGARASQLVEIVSAGEAEEREARGGGDAHRGEGPRRGGRAGGRGVECDGRFEQEARAEAAEKHWRFEKVVGSLDIFMRLVNGKWDEDFLIVPPGARVAPSYNDGVIQITGA